MRAIEQAAIASGEVSGATLMERAGQAVVEAILRRWPGFAQGGARAAVLCGPGNNGGDGFVIARLLQARGWNVGLWLLGAPDQLPPDARLNCDRWAGTGEIAPISAFRAGQADLVVDALFGTGLSRPLAGLEPVFAALARTPVPVVAVDLPSGMSADTGAAFASQEEVLPRAWLPADLIVTFHQRKTGHVLSGLPQDRIVIADIGIGPWQGIVAPDTVVREICAPDADLLRKVQGHKYSYGHALILAGGPGQGGAARLAARAALRIGAGLVTLGAPHAAMAENAMRLDAVMLRETEAPRDLARLLGDVRIRGLCLGPGFGLGLGPAAREPAMLAAALSPAVPRAVVLDADALTLLARDASLRGLLHPLCVLTPHEGEFARLFPDLAPQLNDPAVSRVDLVRAAAASMGVTLLLKGEITVIADAAGRAGLHAATGARAAPWLATAGAGDVLAGLICGLLTRGLAPFDAACTGAWLHVEAARRFGPGLIAEDLPEILPAVMRDLGV